MRAQPQHRLQEPYLAPAVAGVNSERLARWKLGVEWGYDHLAHVTLGMVGKVCVTDVDAAGPHEEPSPVILFLPFTDEEMVGIDATTVRMFRVDGDFERRPKPVWDSGINIEMGFVWAKIRCPGKYVPIGLPRDRLLQQILREIARNRRLIGEDSTREVWAATQQALWVFTEPPAAVVEELREFLTHAEIQTGEGLKQLKPYEIRFKQGAHLTSFPLPHEQPIEEFRSRLRGVAENAMSLPGGMPEEDLFYPPDPLPDVPWHRPGVQRPDDDIDWRAAEQLQIWEYVDLSAVLPYLFPQSWWMYQHDLRHTGAASGLSSIRRTSVTRMKLNAKVSVKGPVISKPVVVDGKIYVGSGKYKGGPPATLYKIDLVTGDIEGQFPAPGSAYFMYQGIGGSPAVVGGRVYFTGVHGKVYCVDANTMSSSPPYAPALWETSLKSPSEAKNQPIRQPKCDSWSGPLVVDGKVYVGCGEGEVPKAYGFVFCLDAETGRVLWLFCTCKFTNTRDNDPNMIPASVAVSKPLPAWAQAAGFQVFDDSQPGTLETGCSVWSSCAYDRVLNRIYVGTGNSQIKKDESSLGTDLPDEFYGSGLLSLDADTGRFCGFRQPVRDDSYHLNDGDVDIAGSPTIFSRNGERVVAFGSKNGSFFLLDPDTLKVLQRRQLLPRANGSGLPHDPGTAIHSVAPTIDPGYENNWGVFATPAVHAGTGKLFVGLGRDCMADPDRTPFVRALDWRTLQDAWPTEVGADNVSRYKTVKPPLYTSTETGLSSPAVVNDVMFISTNRTGLYALDVQDGHCLWAAPALDLPENEYALGPAIYGDYVVMGAGEAVFIYMLGPRWALIQPDRFVAVAPTSSSCPDPPWEGPDLKRLAIRAIRSAGPEECG